MFHQILFLALLCKLIFKQLEYSKHTTRVGNGPFPSELFNDIGDYIAEKGVEFGTVTKEKEGGWLDLVSLKYSCEINRVNELCITKADVLNNLSKLRYVRHTIQKNMRMLILAIVIF